VMREVHSLQPRYTRFRTRRRGWNSNTEQAVLLEELMQSLKLDLSMSPPSDLRTLFSCSLDDVWLEIGFGNGEHTIELLKQHPRIGLIGVEPFLPGIFRLALMAHREGVCDRIRLYEGDGAVLLRWLPCSVVGRIYLLYPDPWPKRRHWKRRFVSRDTLDLIARALTEGAEFRFASDWGPYVNWTLAHLLSCPSLQWTASAHCDWETPWEDWPGTRYERKAMLLGRMPSYVVARRV